MDKICNKLKKTINNCPMSGPIFFIPEVTKWDHVQQKAKIVITDIFQKISFYENH
jgi:hypothetical protein